MEFEIYKMGKLNFIYKPKRDVYHNTLLILILIHLTACTNLLLQPMKTMIRNPSDIGLKYDDVVILSRDGTKLHGWYLPAEKEALGTVVFFHGNAENISTHIASVYWLPSQGYNVLLMDYRGYGLSKGTAEIAGVYLDVQSSLDYILQNEPKGECLVVLGQSLGGALAARTLGEHRYPQINALILDSTFSDYRSITRDVLGQSILTWPLKWPASWLISNEYRPDDLIDKISPMPILLIHSRMDEIIPIHHAYTLYNKAKQPKDLWVLENGGHIHTFVTDKGIYRSKFIQYLKDVCPE